MTTVIRVGIPSNKATLIKGGINTMFACKLPFPIAVEIVPIDISQETRTRMSELLAKRRSEGKPEIELPEFEGLELDAWCVFCTTDIDLALSCEVTYWPKSGSGVSSNHHVLGLLAEMDARSLSLRPYLSSFVTPYSSTTGGASSEQHNSATGAVIEGLIDGWNVQSRRNPGGVLRMRGITEM